MRQLVFITWLFAAGLAGAAGQQVETLLIKSRPAVSLVDTVAPLVGETGGVSAFHDRLIVRGSPEQIAAVRALVDQLDRPPRRLLIEVRHAGQVAASRRDVGYGVGSENVRLGRPPAGDGVQLSYREFQTRGRDDGSQRVQALDGRPALIRAGVSVPVYRTHQQVIGNRLVHGFDVHYRSAMSGFYALPRVHGDQVTVEIYQQHERPVDNGRFALQQASTVLQGALGQWLPLGFSGASDSDSQDHLGVHVQTRREHDQRIELRVLAVD